MIEFSHRLTSGISLLLVIGLVVFSRRVFSKGHPARRGAFWSLVFILGEAGVGASLVLLELVAEDKSAARAIVMALHLVNTFLLLFWLFYTVWFSCYAQARQRPLRQWFSGLNLAWIATLMMIAASGASGAIAALGDTLFPAENLLDGFYMDMHPTAHFLLRLRIWHPVLAIFTAFFVVLVALSAWLRQRQNRRLLLTAVAIVLLQVFWGVANWLAMAPIPLQLGHLIIADVLWLAVCANLLAGTSYGADVKVFDSQ